MKEWSYHRGGEWGVRNPVHFSIRFGYSDRCSIRSYRVGFRTFLVSRNPRGSLGA